MSSENNTIEASTRETKTKSDLNKLRSDGFVPGILYGDIEKNISLSVKKSTLDYFLKTTNRVKMYPSFITLINQSL